MSNLTRDRHAPLVVTLVDESALATAGLPVLLAPFADRAVLVDQSEAGPS